MNDQIKFGAQVADITNIYLKHETLIKKYLCDKDLKKYERYFSLVFRDRPHVLNDENEALLTKISPINSGFSTIFDTLTDTDIKYQDAIDKNKKKIPLKTISDITINLKHHDRCLRKSTWINFNTAFANFENTLTQTLYFNYLMLNSYAKIRNFNNYVDAVSFGDEIQTSMILSLYKNVQTFKPLTEKYHHATTKIIQNFLSLKKVEPWDRSVDIVKTNKQFSIEQAKDIMFDTFKLFGGEYVQIIKKAFTEKWISWLAKQNKQTGAYSIGAVEGVTRQFISMNFNKTIDSIFTLAHELGHSVHANFVLKHQDIYNEVSIFYAEIPSIVNETILAYALLDKYKNDENLCRWILIELLKNFFGTVTRQIIFSNTEYDLINLINNNQPFTKEGIKQIYLQNIKKYTYVENQHDKFPYSLSLSTILRIPHFYVGNFYVYKYAIGQIVAIKIATALYRGDKTMRDKYFKFLTLGSSLPPLECIKTLGIDINNPNVYKDVYSIVGSWIKQLF